LSLGLIAIFFKETFVITIDSIESYVSGSSELWTEIYNYANVLNNMSDPSNQYSGESVVNYLGDMLYAIVKMYLDIQVQG